MIQKIVRAGAQKWKGAIKFGTSNQIVTAEKAKRVFFARASPTQNASKR